MGRYYSIDFDAVREICTRLEIDYQGEEYEADHWKKCYRDRVLFCLSKNVKTLEKLVQQKTVTLYELAINQLLPHKLGSRVRADAPVRRADCDETNEFFHKQLGEWSAKDRAQFSERRLVGRKMVGVVAALMDIYRESSSFRMLVDTPLSAAEQSSLITRIEESVRMDPRIQRRLLSMFPAPAS